ncbi:MAG: hypothetical protein ACK6AD_04310 [Cyanobacteriota bacterium]|jgi:bacteriocin-like protein
MSYFTDTQSQAEGCEEMSSDDLQQITGGISSLSIAASVNLKQLPQFLIRDCQCVQGLDSIISKDPLIKDLVRVGRLR